MIERIAMMHRQRRKRGKMRRRDRQTLEGVAMDCALNSADIDFEFADPNFYHDLPKRNDADQNVV